MKGQTNFEELMMCNADKVIDGEEIEMDFFNIKAFSTETIKSCQGDLFIICNVICDYCNILQRTLEEEKVKEQPNHIKIANFEYYIPRCRKIYEKLSKQLGYDRDKALEKCMKNRSNISNDDVGEDAMIQAVNRGKKGYKNEFFRRVKKR